jgi:hypothetical protein
MSKIPTAENFLIINDDKDFRLSMSGRYVSEMMIEFAKLHVEAALKEASEKADLTDNGRFPYVDKGSILNSYSLDNIK